MLTKGSDVMPIPLLSRESPNLVIVDRCLIASQEVLIGKYVIGITLVHFKTTTVLTSRDQRLRTQPKSIDGAI